MRLVACLLLVSGFFLTVAALVLFPTFSMRLIFICAALGVEVIGGWLLTKGNMSISEEHR